MDSPVLATQQKLIFICIVRKLGIVKKTYQEQWKRMEGERHSSESVLLERLDDDNDIWNFFFLRKFCESCELLTMVYGESVITVKVDIRSGKKD